MTTCCALLAPAMVAGLSADVPQSSAYELPENRQVIAFLLQSIDWYRYTYAERQIANDQADLLFLDDNHPIEAQIVRFSFDFAKAEAALASTGTSSHRQPTANAPASSSPSDLARFISLQSQTDEENQWGTRDIEAIKEKLSAARGVDRAKLQASLDEAQSRLELLQAASKTIKDLVEFAQSAAAGQGHTGDLGSTINDLAQTVPEVNTPGISLASVPGQDESSKQRSSAHDGGIIRLWSDVSALNRKLRVIDEKVRLTDNLALSVQNIRDPMAQFLSHLIQSSAVSSLRTVDLALLKQDKMQLDALTSELNGFSPAIVALDKQKVLLALYKSHLMGWRSTVAAEHREAWKRLIFRLLLILLIMGLLIGFSEVSRRLAERHVQDADRRRRISIAQRLLTLAAILVVAAFGFASDLNSLATYFGLLAAGLAVALQNVILASVGYLLLVGKGGIRIGDRVRISGITGDVIEIGLLQFRLRELDLETQQFTEHVATFSNSLVFVSPATGLVKFHKADEKVFNPDANGMSSRSHAREPRLAARL